MTEKEYTDDQVVSVQRIKKCKDYYEILCVSKDVTEAELKKKYRKLALELHPDKNKAPGAVEAFKAVGNAFAVLSDKDKRKQYDMYGSEEQQTSRRSQYHDGFASYDYSRGFDSDVSAEEIFNMFFGGGFPSSTIYVRRNHNHHNRYRHTRQNDNTTQEEPNLYALFVQLMPVVLLFLLSLMSSYLTPDPAFSLIKTNKYLYERKTREFEIKFYVKETFDQDYKGNFREVEQQVIEEYLAMIRSNCYKERNHKESMLWRAKAYGDARLEQRAKDFKLPNCERLSEFQKYGYY